MPYESRIPVPVAAPATQPLHRIRSENCLKANSVRVLPRIRSLGQLSPPPDEPLPPLPLRSPYRSSNQARDDVRFQPSHVYNLEQRMRIATSNGSFNSSPCHDKDDGIKDGGPSDHNTMRMQRSQDKQEINSTTCRNPTRTPNLDELSHILHFRGRLQQMGCTFSLEGEMLTYGNPFLDSDLHQMLRLGTVYDEQWSMYFSRSDSQDENSNLWPDLRLLKRMLQNEGVRFDSHHRCLDCDGLYPKLIRLSKQYDVLREEWLEKTLQNIHPAFRPGFRADGVPITPANLDWGSPSTTERGDNPVRKRSHRSSPLGSIDEEHSSVQNLPSPVDQGLNTENSSPLATPTISTIDRSMGAPHVLSSSPRRRFGELSPISPTLQHGSGLRQVASMGNMFLRDADAKTISGRSTHEEDAIIQRRKDERRERESLLTRLLDDERRRAEQRKRTIDTNSNGVSGRSEGTKEVGKGGGLRLWLKATFGSKKGRML